MTSGNASYFVDTNVLVYSTVTVPYSPPAIEFIETLLSYEHGPQVFDLQIAATMLTHGLTKLFTYNGADFKGVAEIRTSEPEMPSVTP